MQHGTKLVVWKGGDDQVPIGYISRDHTHEEWEQFLGEHPEFDPVEDGLNQNCLHNAENGLVYHANRPFSRHLPCDVPGYEHPGYGHFRTIDEAIEFIEREP